MLMELNDEKVTEIKVKSEFGCHDTWVTIQGDWDNVKIVHEVLNQLEIEYQQSRQRFLQRCKKQGEDNSGSDP
jgi:hypothetical protein